MDSDLGPAIEDGLERFLYSSLCGEVVEVMMSDVI